MFSGSQARPNARTCAVVKPKSLHQVLYKHYNSTSLGIQTTLVRCRATLALAWMLSHSGSSNQAFRSVRSSRLEGVAETVRLSPQIILHIRLANRFNTKQECEGQCKQRSQNLKLIDPRGIAVRVFTMLTSMHAVLGICSLPFAAGNCGGIEKKWSFDMSAGECRTFTYSGCDGNQVGQQRCKA